MMVQRAESLLLGCCAKAGMIYEQILFLRLQKLQLFQAPV